MSTRKVELAMWGAALVLALVAAHGWRSPIALEAALPTSLPRAAEEPEFLDDDSLDKASTYVVEHDPFRLERRPSDVPYVPGIENAPPAPPAPPKPMLVLTGIMGGPPWQGVVEGFPGTDGSTVVEEGQAVAELRIVRVTKEEVVIEGADTTWTLRVRQAW